MALIMIGYHGSAPMSLIIDGHYQILCTRRSSLF